MTNGKELSPKRCVPGAILKLSFSPNGQMVASITREDPISLWNPTSATLIRRLERFYAARIWPFQGSCGFQHEGKSFAASDVDSLYGGRVSVWNVDDGRPMANLKTTTWFSLTAGSMIIPRCAFFQDNRESLMTATVEALQCRRP